MTHQLTANLHGLLGEALDASRRGRLFHFITDERSPAIALFDPARVALNAEGDWYGEHAGKWLYAAARAAAREPDAELAAELAERVRRVADHLVSLQEPDGYLGTYAPPRRFPVKQPPKPGTWDGAPSVRTWDIWVHSYLILGLLEAHRHFNEPRWLQAARRIGDLCWNTLSAGSIGITELGNHHGLSATVLIDPAVELHRATGEARYLDLAWLVLKQADADPDLALLDRARAGADVSEIATGKAYQLAWNLVGLAKLHRVSGDAALLEMLERLWQCVVNHHLSLGGGPWGGAGLRSREIFNPAGVFSPQGYVETCSTLAWIQLNRELLAITGHPRHADEIERSAYNDLLGAMAPNGEDWCYYSFANGRRVHTAYWRCCKSSGAMAFEELPPLAFTSTGDGSIAVNLYGAAEAQITRADGCVVRLTQHTRYPFEGHIELSVEPSQPVRLSLLMRIPAWAVGATIEVDAGPEAVVSGTYAVIDRLWSPGDRVTLRLPMPPVVHRRTHQNIQESVAPDGAQVSQRVMHQEYLAITRGPLVYATGLIDGFKTGECIRAPESDPAFVIEETPAEGSDAGTSVRLHTGHRAPLDFVPWYRAGGRVDGAWRLTWLALAPEAGSAAPNKA